MSAEAIVFYAGVVHWEFKTIGEYDRHWRDSLIDSDIYNGGYAWYRREIFGHHWYRMDGTPCLLEDVPKTLRVLVLLLS